MSGVAAADILLVDDNPGDIRLNQEAWKESRLCARIHVARDGVEALAFLRRKEGVRPDLILLDLHLPRKDGREVLVEVKKDPELKRIPVVVLSTSKAERDVRDSYGLHANCYISKPLNLDEYVRVVRAIEDFWFATATLPREAP